MPADGNLWGRVEVLATELRHLREDHGRVEQDVRDLRKFRHEAGNAVAGWNELEGVVETLQKGVSQLERQNQDLCAFVAKLQGPGGAIEQLNSLAEDRRFRRRLLGWAGWVGAVIAATLTLGERVLPFIRLPWSR